MGDRATSDDFVPFVPRRITLQVPAAQPVEVEAPKQTQPEVPKAEVPQAATPQAVHDEGGSEEAQSPEADAREAAAMLAPLAPLVTPACNHEHVIRTEAIRLAIIACGRALRHVASIHPKLVAGFVDDALAAAGSPNNATIALEVDKRKLDVGEVIVDCEGCQIQADLQTKAELLVRAAADA